MYAGSTFHRRLRWLLLALAAGSCQLVYATPSKSLATDDNLPAGTLSVDCGEQHRHAAEREAPAALPLLLRPSAELSALPTGDDLVAKAVMPPSSVAPNLPAADAVEPDRAAPAEGMPCITVIKTPCFKDCATAAVIQLRNKLEDPLNPLLMSYRSALAGASVNKDLLRLKIDGSPQKLALVPRVREHIPFSGKAGQRLGLGYTVEHGSWWRSWINLYVIGPDGTLVEDCSRLTVRGGVCILRPLPQTGDYHVFVLSREANTHVTLALSTEVAEALVANGPELRFDGSRIGRNGFYVFEAKAGDDVRLLLSGNTFPEVFVRVILPDGTLYMHSSLTSAGAESDDLLKLNNLPQAGWYRIYLHPSGPANGKVSIAMKKGVVMAQLPTDGSSATIDVPAGQYGYYTFKGSRGQRVGISIGKAEISDVGASAQVYVIRPFGRLLQSCGSYDSDGGVCSLDALPDDGDYVIWIMPGAASFKANLTIVPNKTETITVNGPPANIVVSRFAHTQYFTFEGTAGQYLNLLAERSRFPRSNVVILRPDGSIFEKKFLAPGRYTALSDLLELRTLPISGTYTLYVSPEEDADNGELKLALKAANSRGVLERDGKPTLVELEPGRNGRFTFTGNFGESFDLRLKGLAMNGSGGFVDVHIADPYGQVLVYCGHFSSDNRACKTGTLKLSGDYTVWLSPAGAPVRIDLSLDPQRRLQAEAPTSP